jgi:hypothetical protein
MPSFLAADYLVGEFWEDLKDEAGFAQRCIRKIFTE